MDNVIVLAESVNIESAKRSEKVKKILVRLLVFGLIFIAALCMFTVIKNGGTTLFDKLCSAVDSEYRPVSNAVAYAWSNPTDTGKEGNGGFTCVDFNDSNMDVTKNNATLRPGTPAENWNYGSRTYDGSGHKFTSGGIVAETPNSFSAAMIFYVDIYIDEAMRSAIANGQVTTCTVALKISDSGGAYYRTIGKYYGTFFLCASNTGSTSASLNDMGSNEATAVKTFEHDVGGGRGDQNSGNLTITLTSSMKKIRYGVYFRMTSNGTLLGVTADAYMRAPTTTTDFQTDNYRSKTIKVLSDANGTVIAPNGGYGGAFSTGTQYTAKFDSSNGNGTAIANLEAVADPGYYFYGWSFSSGGTFYYTSSGEATQSLLSPILRLPGGYALTANVTVTAKFKKIGYQDYNTGVEYTKNEGVGNSTIDYTYMQEIDASGNLKLTGNEPIGLRQGPTIRESSIIGSVNDSKYSFYKKSGILTSNGFTGNSRQEFYKNVTTGNETSQVVTSYAAATPPMNAGTYTYIVGIYATSNSNECLGYLCINFQIYQKNQADLTITSDQIPSRVYMGFEYRPEPEYLNCTDKTTGRPFRIMKSDMTNITYNNNINASAKKATITFVAKASGNFSGTFSTAFSIDKRSLNTTEVVAEMASEIQERYDMYYTGYELRPQVLQIRVTAQVTNDAGQQVNKTFILYYGGNNGATYADNYESKGYEAQPLTSVTTYSIVNYDVADTDGVLDLTEAFKNNINVTTAANRASFIITIDSGNFIGRKEVEFDIAPLNLSMSAEENVRYNAKADATAKPIFTGYTVEDQSGTLVYNGNARELVFDCIKVTVKGMSSQRYMVSESKYIEIVDDLYFYLCRDGVAKPTDMDANFKDSDSVFEISSYTNNKNVSYDEAGNVAKGASALVTAQGANIVGSVNTAYAILPKNLKDANARFAQTIDMTYTGLPIEPYNRVIVEANNVGIYVRLVQGSDYTVSFGDNVDATTTAKIYITGKGNYTGTLDNIDYETTGGQFTIVAIDASQNATISRIYDSDGNDFEYALGTSINPQPSKITVTVNGKSHELELGKDYSVVEGGAANTDVGDNNYICIMFAGQNPASSNPNKGKTNYDYGTRGNFYSSRKLNVYFTIAPRDIGKIATTDYADYFASWESRDYRSYVTYDGTPRVNLPIVANQNRDENTVYIQDRYETGVGSSVQKVLRYGVSASVEGTDYIFEGKYGTNINAGPTAGEITVTGVNNYTGELTIKFRIYARSLADNPAITVVHESTEGAVYSTSAGGYLYTGSIIEPNVKSVTDSGLSTTRTLVADTDFSVAYGSESSAESDMNIAVPYGGIIRIEGKGNYCDTYTCAFDIVPISQEVVMLDPFGTGKGNDKLNKETIVVVGAGYKFNTGREVYADYEIANDNGCTIRVQATTTAIYPSARRVTFKIEGVGATVSSANITYLSCEIVDGKSLTTAEISIPRSSYGIMKVYAVQYDSTLGNIANKEWQDGTVGETAYYNYGNYTNYEYNASVDRSYNIYSKRVDAAVAGYADDLELVYGNNDTDLVPKLTSQYTAFKMTVGDESVVRIMNDTTGSRTMRIVGAGQTSVICSHDGYIDTSDITKAYAAFSVEKKITIKQRALTISISDISVPYGNDPVFTLVYTTDGGDGNSDLTYYDGAQTDNPEDIITNLKNNYSNQADGHRNVSATPYDIQVSEDGSTVYGKLYNNYRITFGSGKLTVTKSVLTVYVKGGTNAQTGQLIRKYGEDNSKIALTLSYSGLKYDDKPNDVVKDAPYIDYTHKGKDGSQFAIDKTTPVGSYNVSIKGGKADNYVFKEADVTLLINKAEVEIELTALSAPYTGLGIAANTPTIKGVDGCAAPVGVGDASRIEYKYYRGGIELARGQLPIGAGTYEVVVIFKAADDDNYCTTQKNFIGGVVVTKVAPVIEYPSVIQIEYSASGIQTSQITAVIRGVANGSIPYRLYAEKYMFKKNGTPASNYTDEYPVEKGTYDIRVHYTADAGDNYANAEIEFEAILEITSGLASIRFKTENKKIVEYNGNPVTLSLIDDFYDITFEDKGTGVLHTLSKDNAEIQYYYDGEYHTTGPVDAGTYRVKVIYTPAEGEEVANTTAEFADAIQIEQYDLYVHNKVTLNLSGTAQITGRHVYVYDGKGHALEEDEVPKNGVTDTDRPSGWLEVVYKTGSVTTTSPVNVGTYSVEVTYHSEGKDNYKSTGKFVFENKIEIQPIAPTIETMGDTSYYDFTGRGFEVTALCYGVEVNGVVEQPTGTLVYEYSMDNGYTWSSTLPVHAGTYDVRVTYKASPYGDNYATDTVKEFRGVIVINRVQPVITINNVTFNFGDQGITASYTIKGAQYDTNGPMTEYQSNEASITVSYATREIGANGVPTYRFEEAVPQTSGKYSVRVTFSPDDSKSNYMQVTATQYDCLVIKNVAPVITVDSKTVVYDGTRHKSEEAKISLGSDTYVKYDGTDSAYYVYYGTVNYEYRKVGTTTWTSIAPQSAGTYDVRVNYIENRVNDVFTSASVLVENCLTIKKLVINVAPVYGQGKIYDGAVATGDGLAYIYSYESPDGNIEYVYSEVRDSITGDRIDVSRATYVAKNGEVYTVWASTDTTSIAWRDYVSTAINLVSGEFTVNGEAVNVNYEAIGQTSGETIITYGGAAYIIDLDFNFARRRKAESVFNVKIVDGYFFSTVDAYGRVSVISIDPKTDVSATTNKGTKFVTTSSGSVTYAIDLNKMVATNGNESFKIYARAYSIEETNASGGINIHTVDPTHLTPVTDNGEFVLYKSSSGKSFYIDLKALSAQEAYDITVKNMRMVIDGNPVEFAPSDITTGQYSANGYIGNITVDDNQVTVDMRARTAYIWLKYGVELSGDGYAITALSKAFTRSDLISTGISGLYKLEQNDGDYYIDFTGDEIIARSGSNKAVFNPFAKTIKRSQGEDELVIENVDKTAFTYDRMHTVANGSEVRADTIKLFNADYTVKAPGLISGNAWNGALGLNKTDAGEYDIAAGNLSAGSNYELVYRTGAILYSIDKAQLTVVFTHDDTDNVYNALEKSIEYKIEGLIGSDNVTPIATYYGERRAVDEEGYWLEITVDSDNYELLNNISPKYKIEPAEMEKIVFAPITDIVYDGKAHILKLTDIPSGAKATYDGSETAPSFITPGTYVVTAIVSRVNYKDQEVELSMTIKRCPFSIVPNPVQTKLTYGDKLPELTADTDLGTVALDAGQILDPSVTKYTWTFTPNDENFYSLYEGNAENGNVIKGTIELIVQKAAAKIEIKDNLVQTESNPKSLLAFINDLSQDEYENITIEYVDSDGVHYSNMPTSVGKYTVVVTYGGNEYYAETVYTTTLTIKDESNFDWIIYAGVGLLTLALASTVFFLFRKKSVKQR